MSDEQEFALPTTEHDREANFKIKHLLWVYHRLPKTRMKKVAKEHAFKSYEEYLATAIMEMLRDWDAGKPDAFSREVHIY